ncbi:MAG: hypothetical protein L6V95_07370 [Candidatus Melainabacteria bacterium]|nr:MAG: hypothetical protein L6V95_07370 [Candidatus Melainabacteria bacterium]
MGNLKRTIAALCAIAAISINLSNASEAKMSNEALKYFQSAQNNESEKKYLDAIDDLSKAIEINSREAILYTKQGGLFVEVGDWQKALDAYKKH